MKHGFVADASVGVAWAVHTQASSATDALLDAVAEGRLFVVPPLWPLEVADALIVLTRRRKISAHDCDSALDALAHLPFVVDEEATSHALGRTAALARESGLSVYDAAYLELAIRRRLPLASTDRLLAAAAKRHRVQIVP